MVFYYSSLNGPRHVVMLKTDDWRKFMGALKIPDGVETNQNGQGKLDLNLFQLLNVSMAKTSG